MRSTGYVASFAVSLSLFGCGSTVFSQPVTAQGEGVTLTVRKMKDGPDRVETAGTAFVAAKGDRFLHLWVKLVNLSAHNREWDWSKCALIGTPGEFSLSMILFDMVIVGEAPTVTDLSSHEEVKRELIFAYPDDASLPTRLTCGELSVSFVL